MLRQGLWLPLVRHIAQADDRSDDQNQEQDPETDQEPFQKFKHCGSTPRYLPYI